MADRRGAAVLEGDAAVYQREWRCPRKQGGAIDPEALDAPHQAALDRVRRLAGCDPEDVCTCPGYYVRRPEAHEAVKLLRWLKAGALSLRCPHPSGAVIDALDELQGALSAREAAELERLRSKAPDGR